jgi:hypothetical protein
LIDCNLGKYGCGVGSGDLLIEPIVEVVSRWAMVDESEEGEGGKTLVVDRPSGDEELVNFYRLILKLRKNHYSICMPSNW